MKCFSPVLMVLAVFGVCSTASVAQYTHVETNVTVQNEKGAFSSVICGVDTGATSELDVSLGEFAIPGFPPQPAGLQSALVFRDNSGAILSYRDFRKLGSTRVFTDTFTLMLTPATDASRGETVFFRWAYPLDKNIDSIIISDFFDGAIKRIVLDKRESDTLAGNATNLENFRIIVHYNIKDVVSVEQEGDAANDYSTTVTSANTIRLPEKYRRDSEGACARLYNLSGQEILRFPPNTDPSIELLSPGMYFVLVDILNGSAIPAVRFIKP